MASYDPTATAMLLILFSVILSGVLLPPPPRVQAQQPYGSQIADCANTHNASGLLGYFCNTTTSDSDSAPPSCPTFLTFTARGRYSTLASIGALLGADPATILAPPPPTDAADANANATLPAGTRVLVPATCACAATASGRFYQQNATTAYVAAPGDTLLIIANDTLQGLTTCQALEAQALRGAPPESLDAGQRLSPVPLRCACPTPAQRAAAGARFLVTYLVDVTDAVSTVAARFGVDVQAVADANQLQPPYTIFPYTTLLVPVAAQPNVSRIQTPPAPPPPPPVVAPPPATGEKSGGRLGLYIGVAVAVVAVAAIASAGAFLALRARRRRAAGAGEVAAAKKGGEDKESAASSGFTVTGSGGGEFSLSLSTSEAFSSISVADIRSSLKVYTYAELRAATDGFSPENHIGGSVYRAAFNGDAAAVEVVDRNVSTEVELMRKLNHLSLIRLIGLCHHRGRWYLVTEYAEHGALRDRLAAAPPLTWAQRVQVALDVAEGLRYLHEYARPAWVHMDVSSGSVLLAGDGPRAKLRGFGAARAITGATTTGGAGGEEEEALFTMTSRIAGTRGYMAPEYLEHGVVSGKADVYSLGVVLLELVTGRDAEDLVGGDGVGDPFVALRELAEELELDSGGEAVLRRLEELVDPALPAGSCPQDAVAMLVRLIERCVRRDPARRPTAGEVAQRLLKLSGVSVLGWRNSPESPRSSGSGKGLMY